MTSYELFVTLLGTRSNIPGQSENLINDGIRQSNQEQLFDLRKSCLYCLAAITGDQDHAMKYLLEGRIPAGVELVVGRFGSPIIETLGTRKLASLERTVTNIIFDTQLHQPKKKTKKLCQLWRSSSHHPFYKGYKTDQVQTGLSEGYVDTAQLQERVGRLLLGGVLLALLDLLMVIQSLSSGSDQGDEICELVTKLLDFAIVDLEEEKVLGFFGETFGSVKGQFGAKAHEGQDMAHRMSP